MTLSRLPLSYCTNVHPGVNWETVAAGLRQYTVPVRERTGRPLAAGLWLAASVVREFPQGGQRIADELAALDLTCHTLNAFPYGDFHGVRVKENVYLPDWSSAERLDYTLAAARLLSDLVRPEQDGSISTLPLGFRERAVSRDFRSACMDQLLRAAVELEQLHERTGRFIRLAVEPEPFCWLETTPETIQFFDELFSEADRRGLAAARKYLGVCFDVCHQAVEYEDVADSIRRLDGAGIRINKVHLSCAIQLDNPRDREGRAALAQYAEPRYLHQTLGRTSDGRILKHLDLSEPWALNPGGEFLDAESWRIHFHVPVDAERLGCLSTTRPDLLRALEAVAKLPYAPHLEVETYTWEVLPGARRPDLVEGLSRELIATTQWLDDFSSRSSSLESTPPGAR